MTGRGWEDRVRAHQNAVARFVETAGKLDDVAWHARPAPDKWCPGQVAEHVALTYETARGRARASGRRDARAPALLEDRRCCAGACCPGSCGPDVFPEARAVREIRPPDTPRAKAVVLEALRADAARFEAELTQARGRGEGRPDPSVLRPPRAPTRCWRSSPPTPSTTAASSRAGAVRGVESAPGGRAHMHHRTPWLALPPSREVDGDQRLRPLRLAHRGLPHERRRRERVRGPGNDRCPRLTTSTRAA